MKLTGFLRGSGKISNIVVAQSGGEVIAREYVAKISNPSTPAQVAQRAKLKLMSQIAADLASVIVFRKDGLKSARNQFVSANIKNARFENGEAQIEVAGLQLTPSSKVANLPVIKYDADRENVFFDPANVDAEIMGFVMVVVESTPDNQLKVILNETAFRSADGRYNTTTEFAAPNGATAFVFGLIPNSATAKRQYDDYIVGENNEQAILPTIESMRSSGWSYTRTEGMELKAAEKLAPLE